MITKKWITPETLSLVQEKRILKKKRDSSELGTADWGCLAGRCASLCLQAAHGGRAAGGSG